MKPSCIYCVWQFRDENIQLKTQFFETINFVSLQDDTFSNELFVKSQPSFAEKMRGAFAEQKLIHILSVKKKY